MAEGWRSGMAVITGQIACGLAMYQNVNSNRRKMAPEDFDPLAIRRTRPIVGDEKDLKAAMTAIFPDMKTVRVKAKAKDQ